MTNPPPNPSESAPVWLPVSTVPPVQKFTSGYGWNLKTYVLAVDAKGRMSVGYARETSYGFGWVFAKPIGEPTHWMPLPEAPKNKESVEV